MNNDRVNQFYRQLGFSVARIYVAPGSRQMNEFVLFSPQQLK